LNVVRALSNLSIAGIQGFSLSNSMIKKLYTTNKLDENLSGSIQE